MANVNELDDLTKLVYLLGSLPPDAQREMIRKFTDETNGAIRAYSVKSGG